MKMSLRDLSVGDHATVVGYGEGGRAYRKRLLAMGLTPGAEFTVTRYAPLGDPVEIHVRGFTLSVRRDEAASLLVEKRQ